MENDVDGVADEVTDRSNFEHREELDKARFFFVERWGKVIYEC